MAARIRKGDTVEVTAGKDRGRRGAVLTVDPEAGRVVVEFGPRNHAPRDQVSSLLAQKGVVLGLKDIWDFPLVVY